MQNIEERLQLDHDNAQKLYQGIKHLTQLDIRPEEIQTNMVFVKVPDPASLAEFLKAKDIHISVDNPLRLVTHSDVQRIRYRSCGRRFSGVFLSSSSIVSRQTECISRRY